MASHRARSTSTSPVVPPSATRRSKGGREVRAGVKSHDTERGKSHAGLQKSDVRIHYEEAGSAFPLLVIPRWRAQLDDRGARDAPFQPIRRVQGRISRYRGRSAQRQGRNTKPIKDMPHWLSGRGPHQIGKDCLATRKMSVGRSAPFGAKAKRRGLRPATSTLPTVTSQMPTLATGNGANVGFLAR